MEDISKKIRLLRLEKGWTQKFLANKIGISQTTICRAEISCANIKWIYVIKILNVLKEQDSSNYFFKTFLLQDTEFFVFIEELKKNEKVWALINYDPIKTVKIFIEVIEKNFNFKKK